MRINILLIKTRALGHNYAKDAPYSIYVDESPTTTTNSNNAMNLLLL